MIDVIFICGASGLDKISVAEDIADLMPEKNFNIISSSDIREIIRQNKNSDDILKYSTTQANELGIDSVELLEKQSKALIPFIDAFIKRSAEKKENLIISGTTLLPDLYNLENCNVRHFVFKTNDFSSALEGNVQKKKLKNLDVLEKQQDYFLNLAKNNETIKVIEYGRSRKSAIQIANFIRNSLDNSLSLANIDFENIQFTIKGVPCSGKTTIAKTLTKFLRRYEEARAISTDFVRSALLTIDYDAILAASSTDLNMADVNKQSNLLSDSIVALKKRNDEVAENWLLRE